MKKSLRLIAAVAVSAITCSIPCYGWNNRGHMMVAAVAYQRLTQRTKDRIDIILMSNPDRENWFEMIPEGTSLPRTKMMIFMIAATWPDRIKSNSDYHNDGSHGGNLPPTDGTAGRNIGFDDFARHKYWHFIDKPFWSTTLPPVPSPNIEDRISLFRTVLASTDASDELKAYDLSWLLHLVGDIHQPLHSFWDGVLGGGNAPSTAINAIASLPAPPATATRDLNVGHWVDESFNDARSTAYLAPTIGSGSGPFTIDSAYRTRARTLAEKRVALAGARLANILNNELK